MPAPLFPSSEQHKEDSLSGLQQQQLSPDHHHNHRGNNAATSWNESAVIRGVRLRLSTANQCGLEKVQIQAAR